MIKSIHITNPSASTLELNMRASGVDEGLIIFNMEGLGPPKATVNATGGPNIHGLRATSIKVDARHIILTLAIPSNAVEETAKQKIYDYFPISKEITFRVETDSVKDVYVQALVESVEMNQFAKVENAVISLYCPAPYWLDMVEANPSITKTGTVVVYGGEVSSGMDILLTIIGTGYASDITITNSNGSQSMTFDISVLSPGLPLGINDWIEINTRAGEKSATYFDDSWAVPEDHPVNVINGIGINDDWIQLYPGSNTIGWSCVIGSDESDIEVDLTFRPLFEGV